MSSLNFCTEPERTHRAGHSRTGSLLSTSCRDHVRCHLVPAMQKGLLAICDEVWVIAITRIPTLLSDFYLESLPYIM